jgi:hypothetical protein
LVMRHRSPFCGGNLCRDLGRSRWRSQAVRLVTACLRRDRLDDAPRWSFTACPCGSCLPSPGLNRRGHLLGIWEYMSPMYRLCGLTSGPYVRAGLGLAAELLSSARLHFADALSPVYRDDRRKRDHYVADLHRGLEQVQYKRVLRPRGGVDLATGGVRSPNVPPPVVLLAPSASLVSVSGCSLLHPISEPLRP